MYMYRLLLRSLLSETESSKWTFDFALILILPSEKMLLSTIKACSSPYFHHYDIIKAYE